MFQTRTGSKKLAEMTERGSNKASIQHTSARPLNSKGTITEHSMVSDRKQRCRQLPSFETSTVLSSDDDSIASSSASDSVERSNVASGLFVKTSRPLPLSATRTIPWPRILGRKKSMPMESTDFVARVGETTYFRSANSDHTRPSVLGRSQSMPQ